MSATEFLHPDEFHCAHFCTRVSEQRKKTGGKHEPERKICLAA